jgi:NDP-sugar pyrophosphorylase family protein
VENRIPPRPQRPQSSQPQSSQPELVVMAAGMGSRYGGLKQIDPVGPGGENVLDYSVFDAMRAGFGKVVFVIRRDIEEIFREKIGRAIEHRVECAYVHQELDALPPGFAVPDGRVKPWGTAHAALCARDAIAGPFAVINADDFYGAAAFQEVGGHLTAAAASGQAGEYCMVGYRLDHTLSEHGHVSRGVCSVTGGGYLTGIVERTRIQRFDDGIKCALGDEHWETLAPDTIVSMNIWGFTREFFDHLEDAFRAFLEQHGRELKSEAYLPAVVDVAMRTGRARVKVLRTDARWFGVTYQEDRAVAQRAVRELVATGQYPERLWA